MLTDAQALQEQLSYLRRTIHQNPELGFEEIKTSTLVAETLQELGIETQTGVGKTGVVARLGNGNGPSIGIRADMDALPILEANDVPYKSQVPGKMHACGHDAHTTMLLGVAMLLKDQPINGEIRLLFQPSEERSDAEGISGAPRMIDDGAVEGLDAVIALHVDGTLDRGKICVRSGHVLANSDSVFAKVIGKGGHGAMPDRANDPVFMMGPILTAIHGIVSRRINPLEPAVITVGRMQQGQYPM
jgi:amidohydrolase